MLFEPRKIRPVSAADAIEKDETDQSQEKAGGEASSHSQPTARAFVGANERIAAAKVDYETRGRGDPGFNVREHRQP